MAIRDIYSRFETQERRPFPSRQTARRPYAESTGLLPILCRRKLTILATIAVFLLGGIVYVVMTPPRYLASTAILIDPRLGKTVGSDPVQPGFIVDTGAVESQIKLFTSQTVLSRVAKMTKLNDDPEFNGSERSLLQRILHPDLALMGGVDLKALEEAITIKRPERTYVVSLDVLAKDPKKAAEIANALTTAYVEDQVSARVDSAQDDTRYVRQQLTKLAGEIKDAEDKAEAFKVKNNVVDSNGLRSNEQQVADLTKALGEVRAKAADAKAKLDEVRRLQRDGRLDGASEAIKSLTIERLRQAQAETAQNVAKLAMTLGPHHPELMEARAREARVEKLIRDELRRVAEAAEADYKAALKNQEEIASEVDNLKSQSTAISRNLVPLAQLERNIKILRASYDRFAQIRDSLSQQESDTPPGRVIAVARPPVSPARPKKTIVAIISLSAGLFFGLAAALFAEGASPAPDRDRRPPYEPTPDHEAADEIAARDRRDINRGTAPPSRKPSAEPPLVFDPPAERPRSPLRPRRRYWDDDDA